jgi:hypothetical protein
MVDQFPKKQPVFFSGLSTFSNTPDLVPWKDWENLLSDHKVINIGARADHYPADTLALLDWKKPLQQWAKMNRIEINNRITGKELFKLSKSKYKS